MTRMFRIFFFSRRSPTPGAVARRIRASQRLKAVRSSNLYQLEAFLPGSEKLFERRPHAWQSARDVTACAVLGREDGAAALGVRRCLGDRASHEHGTAEPSAQQEQRRCAPGFHRARNAFYFFLWHRSQLALSSTVNTVFPPISIFPLWQVPHWAPALIFSIVSGPEVPFFILKTWT